MIRRPPRSTRTYTLFPYTTLFRSIGSGSALKQLNLRRADELELWTPPIGRIGEKAADVLERLHTAGENTVVILDEHDHPREWITKRQLSRFDVIPEPTIELSSVVEARSTLSDAMSAMLASSHGGALVTRRGAFEGVLLYDTVNNYIRQINSEAQAPSGGGGNHGEA